MDEQRWSFCIIGGLAVARWGQPRATADVDWSYIETEITPLSALKEDPALLDRLLKIRTG